MHTWRSPTAGGTIEARGEGEEANQRSVYTTRNSYTHKKPSGGVSSPNPDTPSDWLGLTSETSKNHGYFHPFLRNSTQNLDT